MKKLIIILAIFFGLGIANAQTEAETLEWLNAKKNEIYDIHTLELGYKQSAIIEINSKVIHIASEEFYTQIAWSDIVDIKQDGYVTISIVSSKMRYDKYNYIIDFRIYDNELRTKFLKALKHMAILKGAKLVKDDLF